MKRLLLAFAMGASLAAPAFAQTAATGQAEIFHCSAPSVAARTFMPVAPVSRITAAPDTFNSDVASRQAHDAGAGDPIPWKASNARH
jgi:hypothetical protein